MNISGHIIPNASPTWLSLLFFVVGFLLFAALVYVDPQSLNVDMIKAWVESLEVLLYVFLGLSVFLVFWILSELNTKSKHYGIQELLGIVGIIFTVLVIFANLYRSTGVFYGSTLIIPSWLDSLYFSINIFTSNGFGDFLPLPQQRKYVALEALVGFLMTPVIITVAFIIYQKKSVPQSI